MDRTSTHRQSPNFSKIFKVLKSAPGFAAGQKARSTTQVQLWVDDYLQLMVAFLGGGSSAHGT
jgi:hypothetical protein